MTVHAIDLGLNNFGKYSIIDFDTNFGDASKEADYIEVGMDDFESFNQYQEFKELITELLADNDDVNLNNVGVLKTSFGKPVAIYCATVKLVDDKPSVVIGSYTGGDDNPQNVIPITSQIGKRGKEVFFAGNCQLSFGLDNDGVLKKYIGISSDGDFITMDFKFQWIKEVESNISLVSRIDTLEALTESLTSGGGGGLALSAGDICNEDLAKDNKVQLPLTLKVKSWDVPYFPPADENGKVPKWSSINLELLHPVPHGLMQGKPVTNISKVKFFNSSQGGALINPEERIKAAIFLSYGGEVILFISSLAKANFEKVNGENVFKNYSTPRHNLFKVPPKEPTLREYFDNVYKGLEELLENRKFADLLYKDYTLAYSEFIKRFPLPMDGSVPELNKTLQLPETTSQPVETQKRMRKVEELPMEVEVINDDDVEIPY
jgi:hypothetical protein